MIKFDSVCKKYKKERKRDNSPLYDISFQIKQGSNLCILSKNPDELKTFIKLLVGAELPTTGQISRTSSVSPVLSSTPAFSQKMTGEENVRFLCKLYGRKPANIIKFVKEFTEIDKQFKFKLEDVSVHVQKKIAFAAIIGLEFDIYLVNREINAGGDKEFKVKCQQKFQEISKEKSIIMIPSSMKMAKKFTDSALIISEGTTKYFSNLEDGLSYYKEFAIRE